MADRNEALIRWYRSRARSLPWRTSSDPWPILVSEVMSQQTQLARVVPAFERFLQRFPTPTDLAGADLAEVLTLWDGLGYQRRAVNLKKAAAIVADEGWPATAAELEGLPGVGPYTAAALACFAFGQPVAAIDTNLKRVISRWEGRPLAGAALAARAGDLIDADRPADWNQAIMDLAATICRPRSPDCAACPVSDQCTDPTVYVPPPRQSRYEGSVRQARAAILKRLAAGAASTDELRGIPAQQHLESALAALREEGVIDIQGESIGLAG